MVRGAYLPPGCAPSRQIPVLIEADTTDAVSPFDGGWGSTAPSDPTYTPTGVAETRAGWAGLNACDTTESVATEPSGVEVTSRDGCAPGTTVTSRVSTGYGHAWPTDLAPVLAELIDRAT
jgi:poly(3-hydroxybutyrate) depolymerase